MLANEYNMTILSMGFTIICSHTYNYRYIM